MDFYISKSIKYCIVEKKWYVKIRINELLYADKFNSLAEANSYSTMCESKYVIDGDGQ